MKKTKHILLALTSAVMALVVVFAVGCDCKKKPEPGTENVAKTLQSIELDTSNAKTVFIANQDSYSSDGLIIKATYLKKGTTETVVENLTPASKGVTVDSSAFKKDVSGTYEITIFYSYENVYKDASYDVTVTEARAGLDVRLKSGTDNIIGVGNNGTADISGIINLIEVRKPNVLGAIDENSAPLAASEYTVSVYKNSEKIEDLTSVSSGTYQIWASVEYPQLTGYKLEGFVLIFVDDKPVSIDIAQDAVTTQTVSMTDSISKSWSFVVTLSSGQTETVTANSAGVTISGVDTTVMGTDKEATVVYAPGGTAGTLTKTIKYSITAPAEGEGVTIERSFKYAELTNGIKAVEGEEGVSDNMALKPEYFTGSNAFINLTEADGNIYRTSNSCFQIKGDAITLLVQGKGTVSVSFASTGNSNSSRIGLKGSSGAYVAGNTSATAVSDSEAGSYQTSGTGAVTVTWSNLSEGTYTLCSPAEITGRGCRLTQLDVTDLIGNVVVEPPFDPTTEGALHTSNFSYAELQNAIKSVDGLTTLTDKIALKAEYFSTNSTNSFITLLIAGDSANQYRNSNNCFEIKGDALSVTFTGVGYLEVAFACPNSADTTFSRVGVKNSEGNYLKAASTGGAVLVSAPDSDDSENLTIIGAYQNSATSAVTLKFEIKAAGTYKICSPFTAAQNRGARITKITVSDYYN